MLLQILVLCLNFFYIESVFYKNPETDLSKCKVHYSRSGSTYKDFYSISDDYEESANDTSYLFDFHFAVLAPSDAHILIAPLLKVSKGDPVYEIVIGAGGNTFCDIRRMEKSDVKASVRVKGLLSALDPKYFWLHITKDGVIEVGREGEELAFISWIDPDPLPLKYFSFSTWPGIEAKWYFNCDRRHSIEEIEKSLTSTEKLRRHLLTQYDPYVRPVQDVATITTVSMSIAASYVQLDEHKSAIEVVGTAKMMWHDEKLKWDPAEYDGLESFHTYRREIWHPDLMLYNAVGDGRDILADSMMVADYQGHVEWNPAIKLKAWCDAEDMGRWPRDVHTCNLHLWIMRDFHSINLEFNHNDSFFAYTAGGQWKILNVNDYASNDTVGNPLVSILVTLRRNSRLHDIIYFTPFLIIAASQLSIFWLDPFGHLKITLGCGQLVLATIMLLSLAAVIPSHSKEVPYLLHLYSYTFVGTLVSIVISIVIINLSRTPKKEPPPNAVSKTLTSKCFAKTFYLPLLEVNNYGKIDDSEGKSRFLWILLGIVIDRLAFLVYLPLIVYAICLSFY